MTDDTYNGWKNYQTWAISMFLDGNYTGSETPQVVLEIAKQAISYVDNIDTAVKVERPLYAPFVADALKDWVESYVQTDNDETPLEVTTSGIVGDLLGHALDSVDWITLAEHWIEYAKEES